MNTHNSYIGWEQTSTKNRFKNGIQDGMLLDIDLWTILMYLGSQVGMENQLNIDPKRHRKNDAKKQGTKMANKTAKSIFDSREGPYTFCPPSPPGPPPGGSSYKF